MNLQYTNDDRITSDLNFTRNSPELNPDFTPEQTRHDAINACVSAAKSFPMRGYLSEVSTLLREIKKTKTTTGNQHPLQPVLNSKHNHVSTPHPLYSCIPEIAECPHHALFAVYDGHGKEGHHCARFTRDYLPGVIHNFTPNSTPDLSQLNPDSTPDLTQLQPELYPGPVTTQTVPRTCHNLTRTSPRIYQEPLVSPSKKAARTERFYPDPLMVATLLKMLSMRLTLLQILPCTRIGI